MIAGNSHRIKYVLAFGLVLLLLAQLTRVVQEKIEEAGKQMVTEEDILYVTPGRYLKPLVLGYEMAVADIIWLRAIQYMGDDAPSAGTYKWLYPLADTVTDLDPKFDVVYDSAGVILAVYANPKRMDESIAILKKGVENSPEEWRHPFFLSFDYFHYLNDFEAAAKYMTLAAARPNHPPYTEKLAARLYAEAKDPESGIMFLSRVIEATRDEKVKKELEHRLVELVTLRDINNLDHAVSIYKQKKGEWPTALSELVEAGIVQYLPKEPSGGYYYIDANGSVKSSHLAERLRVYSKEGK